MTGLAELSGRRPDDPAVDDGERSLTWQELDDRSTTFGHGLEELGATPGRHVAICVSNRTEFVEAALGAWRAGCAFTPLKTGWTADEVGAVLDDARTRVVVTDRDGARTAASARRLPVVDVDQRYDEWLAGQDRSPLPEDRCGFKLPYTSGTTGRPKGVVMAGSGTIPFAVAWSGLTRWAEALELPGDGVHLFLSRLFNGAPQTFGFGALARGATLRILRQWSPAAALEALAAPDVTSTIMVPTMFRQLLALPDVDRSVPPSPALRTLLHGGEPCPRPVKAAIADWFGEVLVEYYGFTEGGLTVVGRDQWQHRPGTVGRPLPGMHVQVRDETGRTLPPHTEGTVWFVSDRGRRFHYAGDEAKTEQAHQGDAFGVGDIGWIDDEGYLYLCGRSADLVITAGVNVYPAEVEQALSDVDGVADLCAFGVPDEERGESLALHVVLAPGAAELDVLATIERTAGRRLAPYKRPRLVQVVDAVPRDEAGKLLRRVLRDRFASAEQRPKPSGAHESSTDS
ncbi:MAG TPA: AMP-binding protein [Mycobacteriales bacterium]|nr:AMP-binding protein [Mycobacteriales bacterium]